MIEIKDVLRVKDENGQWVTVPALKTDLSKDSISTALGYTPADEEKQSKLKADLSNLDKSAVKSVNGTAPDENGNVNVQGGGAVSDVQINERSVVVDGVANVPLIGTNRNGVCSIGSAGFGIQANASGNLYISSASTASIDSRNSYAYRTWQPVALANFDYAVKSAMCDGKGAAWTADEQAAAQQRMGFEWRNKSISITDPTNTITVDDIDAYSEVYVVVDAPACDATGNVTVSYYNEISGSAFNAMVVTNALATARRFFYTNLKIISNMFVSTKTNTSSNSTAASVAIYTHPIASFNGNYIKSVILTSTTTFPIGTKINIIHR